MAGSVSAEEPEGVLAVLSTLVLLLLLPLFFPPDAEELDFFGSKLSFKTLSLLMRDLREVRSSLAREARKSVVWERVFSLPDEAPAAAGLSWHADAADTTQWVLAARLTLREWWLLLCVGKAQTLPAFLMASAVLLFP